jgi:hypothetical protein
MPSIERPIVDGERKYQIVKAGPGMVRIVALLRRSAWRKVRSETLYPMVKVHGATLHVQELNGQLPPIGFEFPEALLHGTGRSGKAMSAHLTTISDQRKAERDAWKKLNTIKAQIV